MQRDGGRREAEAPAHVHELDGHLEPPRPPRAPTLGEQIRTRSVPDTLHPRRSGLVPVARAVVIRAKLAGARRSPGRVNGSPVAGSKPAPGGPRDDPPRPGPRTGTSAVVRACVSPLPGRAGRPAPRASHDARVARRLSQLAVLVWPASAVSAATGLPFPAVTRYATPPDSNEYRGMIGDSALRVSTRPTHAFSQRTWYGFGAKTEQERTSAG